MDGTTWIVIDLFLVVFAIGGMVDLVRTFRAYRRDSERLRSDV